MKRIGLSYRVLVGGCELRKHICVSLGRPRAIVYKTKRGAPPAQKMVNTPHIHAQAPPFNSKLPPGWFCMYGGHLNTQKQLFLSKFRFLSEFRVCLNWGRVQTCPSRSGRFTTCTIFLSAGRTRRSGFFLVQIVLKVRVSSEARKPALLAPYGGGAPIHTKPTQWPHGARYELPPPPWCPPTTHKPPHCVVMAI